MAIPNDAEVAESLREFGYESFRPGQEKAIRALLAGRDVLAVLPTGSGKSLVYQLTSQLLPGATIVVSPLIALMKDQVDAMESKGVEAGVVNSSMPDGEAKQEMREVRLERTKLLYVTPERFSDEEFLAQMRRTEVSLFVVDEAHCISEWGHDFRPAYLGLGRAAELVGRPPILALTATATPWVRSEIEDRLGTPDPVRVVRGVDRPNLFLETVRVEREEEDYAVLSDLLHGGDAERYPGQQRPVLEQAMSGSGIVYVRTTEAAEETARWLDEWGVPADFYHGRRRRADRERVQEQFMSGEIRVVAATNAFGLGVDKPDVRFVIHRDVPASIESYYQEAGRAGRDGEPARCTLIYRPGDLGRAAFLARSGRVTRQEVAKVRDALSSGRDVTYDDLEEVSGVSKGKLGRIVGYLVEEGIAGQTRGLIKLLQPDFDVRKISLAAEERRKAYEKSRVSMMRAYAETAECRRHFILNYFGEAYEGRCGFCDNDLLAEAYLSASAEGGAKVPFATGDNVVHEQWGSGVVERVGPSEITVLFQDAGYKTLDPTIVVERGILRRSAD